MFRGAYLELHKVAVRPAAELRAPHGAVRRQPRLSLPQADVDTQTRSGSGGNYIDDVGASVAERDSCPIGRLVLRSCALSPQ